MTKKIYLSPAAHIHDNATRCPGSCSENTHCNQYMDIVERRLRELGFAVRRGSASMTGSEAMTARVGEANAWRADIYYVAHTNAGGGRYSMTMCWNDAASRAKAEIFHQYRRCLPVHKVVPRTDLYEIRATAMPCLYDELFFHDNAEDCAWFHAGGMKQMAEEAVQALCEICGVEYREHQTKPETAAAEMPLPKAGDTVTLNDGRLYSSARGNGHVVRSGTFYLYDGVRVGSRYRVTNRPDRVGKKPLSLFVSGWVEL